MARFPCQRCGRRYPGPQQSIYPAIVDGVMNFREHVRLCPTDFAACLEWLQENLLADDSPATISDGCYMGHPGDAPAAVFATVYARDQERQDFYGRTCLDDLDAVRNALFSLPQALQVAWEELVPPMDRSTS